MGIRGWVREGTKWAEERTGLHAAREQGQKEKQKPLGDPRTKETKGEPEAVLPQRLGEGEPHTWGGGAGVLEGVTGTSERCPEAVRVQGNAEQAEKAQAAGPQGQTDTASGAGRRGPSGAHAKAGGKEPDAGPAPNLTSSRKPGGRPSGNRASGPLPPARSLGDLGHVCHKSQGLLCRASSNGRQRTFFF